MRSGTRGQASSGNWVRFVVGGADGGLGVAVENNVGNAPSHLTLMSRRAG